MRVDALPFFVKGLSVGDVIAATDESEGQIWSWHHVLRSRRSTVWVRAFGDVDLEEPIARLLSMECSVERLSRFRLFAIDVSPSVAASFLDTCFSRFNEEQVALAYPSWRHGDA
jgi:hypothetical protein